MVLVFFSVWEHVRNQVHKKISSENIYLKACYASFSRVQSASFLISTLISMALIKATPTTPSDSATDWASP